MRVSESQRYKITNARVERSRDTNAQMLEQISTLKRINKISDDPLGMSKLVKYRDRVENIEQFRSNIDFSKSFLERAETALAQITDNLIRAKELAIGMSNSSYDASGREAASREVRQLLNDVVSLANTQYANRFVFSGFRVHTPTLSDDGKFLGDDGAIFVEVEDNDFRQVNLQARGLFEASEEERAARHFNLYETVEILYQGLHGNSVDGIRVALSELDHQIQKCVSYQATIGSLHGGLSANAKKLEGDEASTRKLMADVEEVDMFKGTSDFKRSDTILQSTLLASNKLLQPSLLNFMQ